MNLKTDTVNIPKIFQMQKTASHFHIETQDVFLQADALPMWKQDYMQISKGVFHGKISDISLGAIQLFRETMDKAVDQHGQPRANSFVVGIPVKLEGEGFWCGDKLETDSVFFLKPNSELKFRTPQCSDIYVSVIDLELLCSYAEDIEEVCVDQICRLSGAVASSDKICTNLRNSFIKVFEGISGNPENLNSELVRQELYSDVMHAIFSGFCMLEKTQPRHPGQFVHRHIVEKTKEYILSRKGQTPTVLEICQELRVSRRTLHYAFQKVLDINPVTYLRYIRLHGARHELITSSPGSSLISDIAANWGFWHLGMFSNYYKQLFGETPSSTIKKDQKYSTKTYKNYN